MADKVLESITFPNLPDRYILPFAKRLKGTKSNDPANSSFNVVMPDAENNPVLSAVCYGKTVAVNQLCVNGDFSNPTDWNAWYCTRSISNNVCTITVTTASEYPRIYKSFTPVTGHTYVAIADMSPNYNGRVFLCGQSLTATQNAWNRVFTITNNVGNAISAGAVGADCSVGATVAIKNLMLIDLSLIFTAAELTAIGTDVDALKAAWLAKFGYPLPQYIPYNAGSLVSNNAVYQLCGKNLWDEETRVGTYNTSTGAYDSSYSDRLCDVNLTPCKPNTTYYFRTTSGLTVGNAYFYDHNGDFISSLTGKGNNTFATPSNACYFHISLGGTYGTTYNHDVCINESDPSFNGQYEPYYNGGQIDNSTSPLNGVGTAQDERNAITGETARKIALVDLGDFDYTYSVNGYFETTLTGTKTYAGNVAANILCGIFRTIAFDDRLSATDPVAYLVDNVTTLHLRNTGYADPGNFKTAMRGIYLAFELATPTTETITPQTITTQEGYNLLQPISGDVQSGAVTLTYARDLNAVIAALEA